MELFVVIADDDIDCWNGNCGASHGRCSKYDATKALSLHDKIIQVDCEFWRQSRDRINVDDVDGNTEGSNHDTTSVKGQDLITQYADILVTRKWLQNRLWLLCLTHNLLDSESYRPELLFTYAVSLAESTLDICRSLPLSSMEAHGLGLVSLKLLATLPLSRLTAARLKSSTILALLVQQFYTEIWCSTITRLHPL